MKAKKRTAPPAPTTAGPGNALNGRGIFAETTALGVPAGGAAAAAGVLTAVDEDEEGDEEAELPAAFDVESEAGGDEEMEE